MPNTSRSSAGRRALLSKVPPTCRIQVALYPSQAEALATDFSGQIAPLVQPITGCAGAGSNGDYSYIGSNNTISYYDTGPSAYSGPGSSEQAYLVRGGVPVGGMDGRELVNGSADGPDAGSERVPTGANRIRRWNRGTHLGRGPRLRCRLRTYLPAFTSNCNGSGNSQQRHRRGLLPG